MDYLKNKFGLNFDKLLLMVMFIGTVGLCIHLMNKADAGGDEMAFLIWAETQAAIILGALLALIKSDTGVSVAAPTPTPTVEPPAPVLPPPPLGSPLPSPLPPPPVEPPLPPPQG